MKVTGITNCMVQKGVCELDAEVSISVKSQLSGRLCNHLIKEYPVVMLFVS
jgi:hypothetical protein